MPTQKVISKSFRFIVARAFYTLMGLRIAFWRREVESLWSLEKSNYEAFLNSALKRSMPKDSNDVAIRSLSALESAPLLTKHALNQVTRCKQQPPLAISRFTSGTSGTRTQVFINREELGRMLAVRDYCFRHYGVKLGEREARLWGGRNFSAASRIKDWLLHRKTFCVTDQSLKNVVRDLKNWCPDYVYGYSSCILSLARYIIDFEIKVPDVRLVVCTAEQVLPAHKKVIKQAFKAAVVEEYGLTEFDIVSFEDSNGDLRLVNPWLVVESQEDVLMVTDTLRTSQSLVRYDTGDIGNIRQIPSEGFGGPGIIRGLQGRIGNRIVYGEDQKVFHASEISRAMNAFFIESGEVFDFIVVQKTPGRCEMHASVEPVGGLEGLCRWVTKDLTQRTLVTIAIVPGSVAKLDQFKGKRSYFIQYFQQSRRAEEGES